MGLVSLAFQQNGNLYAEFLSPRFMSFREAVWSGDRGAAAYAARRMAGCGPGLTPSSDDLLCGYIAAMPKEMKKTGYASAIAQSAAAETNDISSSLLTWSGKNFFAESILALKNCLCFGPDEAVQLALQRVADFGHSSGYDFLTGFYFGLLDTYKNGGMRIEEARSSQKYLL